MSDETPDSRSAVELSPDAIFSGEVREEVLRCLCGKHHKSRADAEDIAQEAFLAIARSGGWKPSIDPKPGRYACFVAGRLARKRIRGAMALLLAALTSSGAIPETGWDPAAVVMAEAREIELEDVELEALELLEARIEDDEELRALVRAEGRGIEDAEELAITIGVCGAEAVYNLRQRLMRHTNAVHRELVRRGRELPDGYRPRVVV